MEPISLHAAPSSREHVWITEGCTDACGICRQEFIEMVYLCDVLLLLDQFRRRGRKGSASRGAKAACECLHVSQTQVGCLCPLSALDMRACTHTRTRDDAYAYTRARIRTYAIMCELTTRIRKHKYAHTIMNSGRPCCTLVQREQRRGGGREGGKEVGRAGGGSPVDSFFCELVDELHQPRHHRRLPAHMRHRDQSACACCINAQG